MPGNQRRGGTGNTQDPKKAQYYLEDSLAHLYPGAKILVVCPWYPLEGLYNIINIFINNNYYHGLFCTYHVLGIVL